jgi:23S rRNA (uracil1939-C5)-methyltransferase
MANEAFEARIESIAPGGEGVARAPDGRVAFVPYAAPGDYASLTAISERKHSLECRIDRLIEASPDRVEPECPLFGRCGGCALMHLAYDRQLEAKRRIVEDCCARIGGFAPAGLAIVASPPLGARNRFLPRFLPDGSAGLAMPRSNESTLVPACPVAHESVSAWFADRSDGSARGASVRSGSKDAISSSGPRSGGRGGRSNADEPRFVVFGSDSGLYSGTRGQVARAAVAGREFSFDVAGFFQANVTVFSELVARFVRPLSGSTAVDLFSGCGVFASFLADSHERVVAVERDGAALSHARTNASRAKARVCGAEEWILEREALDGFDTVVVDPPRAGLPREVLDYLSGARWKRLLYVSCDPATFARDARVLLGLDPPASPRGESRGAAKKKATLARIEAFDMYPNAAHVECAALFERQA